MKKVLLVNMPWSDALRPSIQLGILTAYLKEQGIEVDNQYFNLKLAEKLGYELYFKIARTTWHGSLLYAEILYDRLKPEYTFGFEEDFHEIDLLEVRRKLREYHEEILEEIDYAQYDIVGFTNGFQQVIPSLSVAKRIKERYPQTLIVFGGSSCYAELGESLLRTYEYLDIVVSGEGEETLLEIVNCFRQGKEYENIPGTYCRKDRQIYINSTRPLTRDLDRYPFPDYEAYFSSYAQYPELNLFSNYSTVVLPIEGSRGCWWKKCAFCGLNRQFIENETHTFFRPKSTERIVAELQHQREKYKIEQFGFCDCINFRIGKLAEKIVDSRTDFILTTECRASVSPEEIYLMREAGYKKIQLGIESFSNGLLKKMQKGVTALENIHALKWCEIFQIHVNYNIIKNFPLEAKEDVRAMIELARKITHLTPPVRVSAFHLDYQSIVYQRASEYNITNVRPPEIFAAIYGSDHTQLMSTSFDYAVQEPLLTDEEWAEFQSLHQDWVQGRKIRRLSYLDGGSYLKIIDTRESEKKIGVVDTLEREIYLYCNHIRTLEEISTHFDHLDAAFVHDTLHMFLEHSLMLEEEGSYLSLAIPSGNQGYSNLLDQAR